MIIVIIVFLFQRTLSGDEEKTELLPTGWNDKDNYALRYVLDNKLFILHGFNTDGNLIVNLMVIIIAIGLAIQSKHLDCFIL